MQQYIWNEQVIGEDQLLAEAKRRNISLDELIEANKDELKIKPLSTDKHATIEQMKEGVSWLQAEGDFVSNMNEYYKGTGVTFKEAIPGSDAFTMYDAEND